MIICPSTVGFEELTVKLIKAMIIMIVTVSIILMVFVMNSHNVIIAVLL